VEENKKGIARIFDRFLDVDDPEKGVIFVDNEDWLGALTYLEVLRTYGPHFTLNRMLTFDSVKRRLSREQPLTFLEFNYMILQAVDYLELSRRYDCVLQLGGSDQWGNIVNGTELVRRMDGRDVFGLTTPLITTSSGAKMGKTAEGTVWLDPTMTSAYAYWQFWRNTADADVGRFLRLYTEVPVEEIEALEALSGAELNQAKIRLAMEATTLLHGAEAAENARQTAEQVFAAGGVGEDLPRLILSPDEAREGLSVVDGLIRAELAASKGEARRHIQGGGVRIDGEVVDDPYADLPVSETMSAPLRLSLGKKRHVVVELGDPAAD
jgi:tyrosyl-tRNA synthetase